MTTVIILLTVIAIGVLLLSDIGKGVLAATSIVSIIGFIIGIVIISFLIVDGFFISIDFKDWVGALFGLLILYMGLIAVFTSKLRKNYKDTVVVASLLVVFLFIGFYIFDALKLSGNLLLFIRTMSASIFLGMFFLPKEQSKNNHVLSTPSDEK